jgi:hypothetical protein
MVLRELTTLLGFDVDFAPLDAFDDKVLETKAGINDLGSAADDALDQVKSALKTARNLLIGFAIGGAGVAATLIAITKSAASAGDEISKTAPMLGFSAEEYQKYRYAAELAGVENESFVQSTQQLLNHVGELKSGNLATAASFKKVGLSVAGLRGMTTADIYRRISMGLERIPDQATRIQVSMDLLGRSGARMGTFLAKGTANLDAMMADVEAFGMFTSESAAAANDLNDSLDRVRFFLAGIKNEIGAGLFPVFKGMLDDFRNWLSLHRDIIKTRIQQFVHVLTIVISKAWEATKSAVHGFEVLIRAMGGLTNALWLLGIAIVAPLMLILGPLYLVFKAVVFLFLPFLRLHTLLALITFAVGSMIPLWHLLIGVVGALVATKVYTWLIQMAGGYRVLAMNMALATIEFVAQAAALAFLILAFEDITGWLMGNKSLIGEWLGEWDTVVPRLKKIWTDIQDVFRAGGKFMAAVFRGDFREAYRLLEAGTAAAGTMAKNAAQAVAGGLSAPAFGGGFSGGAAGWAGMAPAYAFAGAPSGPGPGRGGPGIGSFKNAYTLVRGQDGEPTLAPAGGKAGGSTVVHQSNKIDLNLNLKSGTSQEQAKEIVGIVNDTLKTHIDHSLQQSVPPGG